MLTFATGLIASVLAGPWTASTNGTDFVSARVPGYHGDTFPGLLTGEAVYRTACRWASGRAARGASSCLDFVCWRTVRSVVRRPENFWSIWCGS